MTRVGPLQQCPLAGCSDPDIQLVPLPAPVPLVPASLLRCPELDLSLPLSPDPPRPNPASLLRGRRHRQVSLTHTHTDGQSQIVLFSVVKTAVEMMRDLCVSVCVFGETSLKCVPLTLQVRFASEEPVVVTVIAEPSKDPPPWQCPGHSSSYSKGKRLHGN